MILTLTPNPSIDATLDIPALRSGEVVRATGARREAGGKGINVSHVAAKAGVPTVALAPCGADDPFELAARRLDIEFAPVPINGVVRTNTALTEPDGTTTKVNELGPALSDDEVAGLIRALVERAPGADAVVAAGSLPPAAPADFYARVVTEVRQVSDALIAVDTSDAPLVSLGDRLDDCAPDVMKPNAFELAQLTGADGHALETAAAGGDFETVIAAAQHLIARGARDILITLGGAGACLVTPEGAWGATAPAITVRSTVGAGDSALTGYVMARIAGDQPAECLRRAVAYGSAAASLPGTGLPGPDELDLANTDVFPISV